MRTLILLLALVIAGCAAPADDVLPAPEATRTSSSPATFEWATKVSASALEPTVLVFSTAMGLSDVRAAAWSDASAFASLRIEVAGCGEYWVPGSSAGSGSSFGSQEMCKHLAAGNYTVRIFAEGVYEGILSIEAQVAP